MTKTITAVAAMAALFDEKGNLFTKHVSALKTSGTAITADIRAIFQAATEITPVEADPDNVTAELIHDALITGLSDYVGLIGPNKIPDGMTFKQCREFRAYDTIRRYILAEANAHGVKIKAKRAADGVYTVESITVKAPKVAEKPPVVEEQTAETLASDVTASAQAAGIDPVAAVLALLKGFSTEQKAQVYAALSTESKVRQRSKGTLPVVAEQAKAQAAAH